MATIFINLKQKLNQQMRITIAAAAAVLAVSAINIEREPTVAEVYAQLTEEFFG